MYGNMWLVYGGLVLTDTPYELGDDFLSVQRSSLQETLDFILADIASAMSLLPDNMENRYVVERAKGRTLCRLSMLLIKRFN